MKLSTNSRYGLRAMVDLAANYTGVPVSLAEIAERQHVSLNYLEQAFAALRKAALVRSAKGAQGGYAPVGNPKDVTVAAILRVLEGDLSIIDDSPVYRGDDPVKSCIKRTVWDAIDKRISDRVESVTLSDLTAEYWRMRGNAQN